MGFVRIERKKLDAFLARGGQIQDMGLAVGQLDTKARYPVGHRGRKSRRKAGRRDIERKARRGSLNRQLEGLTGETAKATRRELTALLTGKSGRAGKRSKAVRVIKVAGIWESADRYHRKAITMRRGALAKEMQRVRDALLGRGRVAAELIKVGRNTEKAVKQSWLATGHSDTGRLLRNIKFEFYATGGKAKVKRIARNQRSVARG